LVSGSFRKSVKDKLGGDWIAVIAVSKFNGILENGEAIAKPP